MAEKNFDNWYMRSFDEFYLDLYAHRDDFEARRFVDHLEGFIPLRGALVLDLACGSGRYMEAFEAAGALAVGLDLSAPLLREAGLLGREPLVRADMRYLPFRGETFDCVTSMFTSFGYFADLGDEMLVIREVQRCLKLGGRLVIDYMNSDLVRRSLEPVTRREVRGTEIVETRSIRENDGRVVKRIEIYEGGRLLRRYMEAVRLFTAEEIGAMLTRAGLRPSALWGDYNGAEYDKDDSPRMIVVSEKE